MLMTRALLRGLFWCTFDFSRARANLIILATGSRGTVELAKFPGSCPGWTLKCYTPNHTVCHGIGRPTGQMQPTEKTTKYSDAACPKLVRSLTCHALAGLDVVLTVMRRVCT